MAAVAKNGSGARPLMNPAGTPKGKPFLIVLFERRAKARRQVGPHARESLLTV